MTSRTQFQETYHGQVKRTVQLDAVVMLQAEHKYVICYHRDGQLVMSDTLDSLEAEFPGRFVRLHRSRMVAKHLIRSVRRKGQVFEAIVDGLDAPVAVAKRLGKAVIDKLAEAQHAN